MAGKRKKLLQAIAKAIKSTDEAQAQEITSKLPQAITESEGEGKTIAVHLGKIKR